MKWQKNLKGSDVLSEELNSDCNDELSSQKATE